VVAHGEVQATSVTRTPAGPDRLHRAAAPAGSVKVQDTEVVLPGLVGPVTTGASGGTSST
jgi:hypothetical protein